jgi:hypothetical protein
MESSETGSNVPKGLETNDFQAAVAEFSDHFPPGEFDTRKPEHLALIDEVTLDDLERKLEASIVISKIRVSFLDKGTKTDDAIEAKVNADMDELKARKALDEHKARISSRSSRDNRYAQESAYIRGFRNELAQKYGTSKMVGHASGKDAARTAISDVLTKLRKPQAAPVTTPPPGRA